MPEENATIMLKSSSWINCTVWSKTMMSSLYKLMCLFTDDQQH